jgi:predicted RNA polymerase sigma factor
LHAIAPSLGGLDRLGRGAEAAAAFDGATALTHDPAERRYLRDRRERVGRPA